MLPDPLALHDDRRDLDPRRARQPRRLVDGVVERQPRPADVGYCQPGGRTSMMSRQTSSIDASAG